MSVNYTIAKNAILNQASEVVKQVGEDISNEAKLLIKIPSISGKRVKRSKGYHEISKRGDAPNDDTGDLKRSISAKHNGNLESTVTASEKYAIPLETSLERPFLSTAFNNNKKRFKKELAKAIKKVFK